MKRAIIVLVLLAVVAAGAGYWYFNRARVEVAVNTVPVTRGDIIDSVGATGTVQAVTTVQVGSQVSGNIEWLGADFNSIVKKGQVVARLDPSLFDAQLQQVQANLAQARANLIRANSELDRTKVQLTDAQQKFTRARDLSTRSLIAPSELDSAKVAVDSAAASVASQQASVTQSQAAVTQAQASVNQSQVNRDHTVIMAPIDGIVTQRSVDVGQTVAASMSAPTLFIIAADLTEMQVNANIDEADVGRIRPGQHVTFRVDAYPTDNFEGTVTQIRLQPVVVQNVTTYGTVITVPNKQLKLKPGMTANVKIEIAKRTNALRIPNAALRFRPTNEIFAAFKQEPPPEMAAFGGAGGGRGGRGGRGEGGAASGAPPVAPAPVTPAPTPAAPARAPASASARPEAGELRRDLAVAASGGEGGPVTQARGVE
jgi:HlyD family secretion protein